ncbi:hypothetical protein Tco_0981546 [Tanacetum coccineum]
MITSKSSKRSMLKEIVSLQVMSKYESSYARAMIELRDDVELKDTIVVVMPKLIGEGFYTCTICVEYDWKPPRRSNSNPFNVLKSVENYVDFGTNEGTLSLASKEANFDGSSSWNVG